MCVKCELARPILYKKFVEIHQILLKSVFTVAADLGGAQHHAHQFYVRVFVHLELIFMEKSLEQMTIKHETKPNCRFRAYGQKSSLNGNLNLEEEYIGFRPNPI